MGRITNLLKAATGVIGWHLPPGKDRRGKAAKAPRAAAGDSAARCWKTAGC